MSRGVKCTCGHLLVVKDSQAGKPVRCSVCNKVKTVPTGSANDAGYSFAEPEAEADPIASAPAAKLKRARPQGHCHSCDTIVKGKPYYFFAGFEVDRQSSSLHGGRVEVRTTYCDMARHDVFLCDACAEAAWKKKFALEALGWSIPAVVLPVISLILFRMFVHPEAFVPILIVHGIFFLCFAGFLLVSLWRVLRPTLEEGVMEDIILGIARRDFRDVGDTFFKPGEFRGRGRGDYWGR